MRAPLDLSVVTDLSKDEASLWLGSVRASMMSCRQGFQLQRGVKQLDARFTDAGHPTE
jgi:hypothetical protein